MLRCGYRLRMRKVMVNQVPLDEIPDVVPRDAGVAYTEAVVIEFPDYKRVIHSGVTADTEPDMYEQTRDVLKQIQENLGKVGGAMDDIVRIRIFIDRPRLSPGSFREMQDARSEFFTNEHFPASTLIETGLFRGGKLIEVDCEAIIPVDGWDVDTIE